MKSILINIDDWLSVEDLTRTVSNLVSIQSEELKVTLLKSYLVGCVDTENAVEENDRIKLQTMKQLGLYEASLLKSIIKTKVTIDKKVKMGSIINVIPRIIEKDDYDILLLNEGSRGLIDFFQRYLSDRPKKSPFIVIGKQ